MFPSAPPPPFKINSKDSNSDDLFFGDVGVHGIMQQGWDGIREALSRKIKAHIAKPGGPKPTSDKPFFDLQSLHQ